MKVSTETWESAVNKLRSGIKQDEPATVASPLYNDLVKMVKVGRSVLDVGCGDRCLKLSLPSNVVYFGLDAFTECADNIIGKIEDDAMLELFLDLYKTFPVQTIFAMAVMDGVEDFDKAIINMKMIARKNIVFLTGINIEPDEKHTLKLQLSDFRERFTDWKETLCHLVKQEGDKQLYLLQYENPERLPQ